MIKATLRNSFDLLATAPRGVPQLREMFLGAALRGQLNVVPVEEQTASVKGDSKTLLREFPIPKLWKWRQVGEICDLRTGATPSKSRKEYFGGNIPWLVSGDIHKQEIFECEGRITPEGIANSNCKVLPKGSVLIALNGQGKTRATVALLRFPAACNQSLIAMTPKPGSGLSPEFLFWNLRYRYREIRHITGDKQRRGLNMGLIRQLSIVVPPIEEQYRIVARVEELMRLCDALETKGQLEATQHAQLVSTLLGTLIQSEMPEQLSENWNRISTHFDILLDRPETVDALEQTILQLAVRGLLVPQNPQDGSVNELLKKIRTEKDKRITKGRSKRDKPLSSITDEKPPFALPPGWGWTRFPDLCAVSGGATPAKAIPQNWEGSIPWVSPKDMKVPYIADAQDHVSDAAVRGSLSLIPSGSLLMVIRGMILAHSFPIAETLVPVTINQDMKALTPFEPATLSFLALLCRGLKPEILALTDRSSHGTCKLESSKIFGMLIPLPPLAEQSRIVTRVKSLHHICNNLRKSLAASRSAQAHLAEALVQEVA